MARAGYRSRRVSRNISNYTTEVVLTGDWDKATRFLGGLDKAIIAGSIKGQEVAAKKLKLLIQKALRSNGAAIGANWANLSISTVYRRGKMGLSTSSILYATGFYERNIMVRRKGMKVTVGIKPKVRHPLSKKLTLNQIATINEYGSNSRNIPARPLWRPAFKAFGGGKRIKSHMKWHIADQIKKQKY